MGFIGSNSRRNSLFCSAVMSARGARACPADNPISKTYPCHMMCRANSITHYENLANLDQVANRRFTFIGLPLKVRGAHGGPTRAAALVED